MGEKKILNHRNLLKYILVCIAGIGIIILLSPQLFNKNKGNSISVGAYNNGVLKNGFLLPRKGANYVYGSFFSYYLLGRAYVHSRVYKTIIDTYNELHILYPEKKFYILECSRKEGGKMFPHRTHQNGLSVDFFSPLVKNNKSKHYKFMGLFRYAFNFNDKGTLLLNPNVSIDFNTMARHIMLLDKNARKNGMRIKKVIFNTKLKAQLFQTENGKILKLKHIYFAKNLSPLLNKLHDDHYHVDFEPIP